MLGLGLVHGDEPLDCPKLVLARLIISEGQVEVGQRHRQKRSFPTSEGKVVHLKAGEFHLEYWQTPKRI